VIVYLVGVVTLIRKKSVCKGEAGAYWIAWITGSLLRSRERTVRSQINDLQGILIPKNVTNLDRPNPWGEKPQI